ncbi:MAG: dTDP-4-dehydrorhamnose reductase [Bacteroidales bacterium]
MNILVTGAKGQLGNEIKEVIQKSNTSWCYHFTDKSTLNITQKKDIEHFILNNDIDIILNCAAYTDVDGAEEDADNAFLINGTAVGYLAEAAQKHNTYLIHISTDYIFNGKNYIPYKEDNTPNPESTYGKSKLEGEKQVIRNNAGIIIRTSWLYSSFGKNFVKTITKLAKESKELKVVYDQIGSPTYAHELAKCIVNIMRADLEKHKGEIYHFANEGVCSWYDLAKEVTTQLKLNCIIHPVESNEFPTKAQRPPYSVFNKEKIKKHFKIKIPHWKDSLTEMLETSNH